MPLLIPYVYVAIGGALGSMGRYGFGLAASRWFGDAFPWGTIAINIIGSFVIGFFAALTMPDGALPASANMRTFVMVGICGGFTTFSSFSLQTLSLARDGNWFAAMGNIVLSVVCCLLAVTAGQAAADRIGGGRSEVGMIAPAILAILDRTETARPVLAAAGLAANLFGSGRIEALHIRHDAMQGFMPTEDVMTPERRREIDGEAARRSTDLHALFDAWKPPGRSATWREATGETSRIVQAAAGQADLIVMARPPAQNGGTMRQALHAALFDAGRLTLLVADDIPAILGQTIAVAWKPSAAADRTIEAALPWLSRARRVTVLIGTEGSELVADPAALLRTLAAAKVPVAVRRFNPGAQPIGEAILDQARNVGADLLVMGAYSHNRFVEIAFGGATRTLLAYADLPILLHH